MLTSVRPRGTRHEDSETHRDQCARAGSHQYRAELRQRQREEIALVVDRRGAVVGQRREQRCEALRREQKREEQRKRCEPQEVREPHASGVGAREDRRDGEMPAW